MVFETPGAKEIILRPSAGDRRLLRAINEKHVVAFAPPIILVLQDGHGHTGILAGAFGVKPNVIILSGKVSFLIHQRLRVRCPLICPAVVGLRLTILRMEIQRSRRKGCCVRYGSRCCNTAP